MGMGMGDPEWTGFLSPGAVFFGLAVYYLCVWGLDRARWRAKGVRMPPGPPQSFIVGNLAQMPRSEPWLTFTAWAKTYGPIVYFRIFSNKTILLNTPKAAIDLLESRSPLYSERPLQWMAGELTGRQHGVFLTSFSDPRFRPMRRLLLQGLGARAARSYRPVQLQESRVLLRGLREDPAGLAAHIRRNAVAVMLKVAYGYQVSANDDDMVRLLEETFRTHNAISVPGKYWVEFFPFLRYLPEWLPGAGFKRVAREFGRRLHRIESVPLEWARANMETGDFVESFTSKHLYTEDDCAPDEKLVGYIKWCAAGLYIGGGDTTVSALTTFFLLMALYPGVQKKAQEDVDRVSPNGLPTFDDYESLPYIRAMIREILRWAPVAPLGIPHRALEDDVYEGYFIPKGTRIIANIWAFTHNEEIYPNPHVFDPTRHLGDSPQPDPFRFVFGFGRRVCPGAHVAEMSLFLNISNILATFDISKSVDEHGAAIEPSVEWTTGVTRHLKPFDCQITPRPKSGFL